MDTSETARLKTGRADSGGYHQIALPASNSNAASGHQDRAAHAVLRASIDRGAQKGDRTAFAVDGVPASGEGDGSSFPA